MPRSNSAHPSFPPDVALHLKAAAFTLETLAHLRGYERDLLPLADKLRFFLAEGRMPASDGMLSDWVARKQVELDKELLQMAEAWDDHERMG